MFCLSGARVMTAKDRCETKTHKTAGRRRKGGQAFIVDAAFRQCILLYAK